MNHVVKRAINNLLFFLIGKKNPVKRIKLKISSFPNRTLNYEEPVIVHCSVTGHPRPILR